MAEDNNRIFREGRYEKMIADGDENIVTMGIYHPAQGRNRRMREEFGKFEQMIWALKNGNARTMQNVTERLDEVIERGIVLFILKQSGAGRCVMFAIAQTDTSRFAGWSVVRGGEYWKKLVRQAEKEVVFTKPHKIYIAERRRTCEKKGAVKSEFYAGKCKRYFDPAEDAFDTFGMYGEMRLQYLINCERKVYWHLVLNGELENHLEWVQESTEECRDSYFDLFLNVFPSPEIEEFDRWLLHMEYVYEFAECSAIRDSVLMYRGDVESLDEQRKMEVEMRG